ncbi:hypothetical protein [Streptomyces buecherae]|uniref:hypothetical protein n=1 Tax=Streptomyces buecherae TaxID=2763006 RepID=UPI00367E6E7D
MPSAARTRSTTTTSSSWSSGSRARAHSEDPYGPTPTFDTTVRAAFVVGVKAGDFTA